MSWCLSLFYYVFFKKNIWGSEEVKFFGSIMFGIEIICFSLGNDVLLIRMIFILFLYIKGCEVN